METALDTVAQNPYAELFAELRRNAPKLAAHDAKTRAAKLKRLVAYLQANLESADQALRADLGRTFNDNLGEFLIVKTEADTAIKNLKRWLAPQKVKGSMLTFGQKARIQAEPKGVVLIFATWNAPIAITLVPLIGALAAGNAVVLKPSELAPASAAFLRELVAALFAPDEVALVEGGPEVAESLLDLPFDHIHFTGSPAIGKRVMAAAAEHLASVSLELGGKSPAIVDPTVDLATTARKLVWGKFTNCGQACIAPDYVLAHQRIARPLIDAMVQAVGDMYDPAGRGIEVNPGYNRIINRRHFDRLSRLLDAAVEPGAYLECGGARDADARYIAPTILSQVAPEMAVMQEEIFGPLMPVLTWHDESDLLAFVNDRPKPLALYVFSEHRRFIDAVLARTSAGSSVVNHNLVQAGVNPNLPFGGTGGSGFGRLVGKATFDTFSNPRSIVEQKLGWRDISKYSFPPHEPGYTRALKWLLMRGKYDQTG